MDISVLPRVYGRTLGPVVFEVEHEDGGHFAAHERPNVFAGDLKKMFGKGGGAYDVTKKTVPEALEDLIAEGSGWNEVMNLFL